MDLMKSVAECCWAISQSAAAKKGDNTLVISILASHQHWKASTYSKGKLIKDACIPSDESSRTGSTLPCTQPLHSNNPLRVIHDYRDLSTSGTDVFHNEGSGS